MMKTHHASSMIPDTRYQTNQNTHEYLKPYHTTSHISNLQSPISNLQSPTPNLQHKHRYKNSQTLIKKHRLLDSGNRSSRIPNSSRGPQMAISNSMASISINSQFADPNSTTDGLRTDCKHREIDWIG